MVKILENKLIDLDILPGTAQIEAQKLLREQLAQGVPGVQAASKIAQGQASGAADAATSSAAGGVAKIRVSREQLDELVGEQLSKEQKDKIMEEQKSMGGVVVGAAGNVVKGLAGTVGGVVKGVGDTGLNTVYTLGSGVGNIGTGLAGGLTDTAKAATGNAPQTATVRTDEILQAASKPPTGTRSEETAEVGGANTEHAQTVEEKDIEDDKAPEGRKRPRKIELR